MHTYTYVEGEGDERSYFKEGQASRLKAGFLCYNLEAEFSPFQKTSVLRFWIVGRNRRLSCSSQVSS